MTSQSALNVNYGGPANPRVRTSSHQGKPRRTLTTSLSVVSESSRRHQNNHLIMANSAGSNDDVLPESTDHSLDLRLLISHEQGEEDNINLLETSSSSLPTVLALKSLSNLLGEDKESLMMELSPIVEESSSRYVDGSEFIQDNDDDNVITSSPFIVPAIADEHTIDLGGLVLNSEENGFSSSEDVGIFVPSGGVAQDTENVEEDLAIDDLEEIQAVDEEPTWRALDTKPTPERKPNNGDEFVEVHVIGRNSDQTVMSLSEGDSQRQIVFCPSTDSGMFAWLMSGLTSWGPSASARGNEEKKDESEKT